MSHFYKNIKETEVKVGIFVVVCLLVLLVSYSWLNDWFLQSKYVTIQVLFDNVGSLEKGQSVYYRGVRVGSVSALNFTQGGILVDLYIQRGVNINTNALFYVKDKDMMGTKMVDILPGDSFQTVNPNEVYKGTNVPGLVDLVVNVNTLMDKVNSVMLKLEDNKELFTKLDKIVGGVDSSMVGIQSLITDLQKSDLTAAFTELKSTSIKVSALIDSNAVALRTTIVKIDSLATRSTNLITTLKDSFDKEDSNFNKIFNDEELYKSLVKSAKEADSLLIDVKKNPKKYFKFSIF